MTAGERLGVERLDAPAPLGGFFLRPSSYHLWQRALRPRKSFWTAQIAPGALLNLCILTLSFLVIRVLFPPGSTA